VFKPFAGVSTVTGAEVESGWWEEEPSGWLLPDGFFRAEVEAAHPFVVAVAERLAAEGLKAEVTPLRLVESHAEIKDYEDEFDLLVGERRPARVEVKARNLPFTSPVDYPYPTAIVETWHGLEAKKVRPVAEVLVSRETMGMVVVPFSTWATWTRRWRFDTKRKQNVEFAEVQTRLLESWDRFVEYLRRREQG
jgi:hypothetical protein